MTKDELAEQQIVILRHCVKVIEEYIEADYPPYTLAYPHNVQKKKNDMEEVDKINAVITMWEKLKDKT